MIIFFDKLPSTNDYSLKYGKEFKEWTIIWAKVQTKGRGRLGRNWFSPEGGLWFSIVLQPGHALPLLPLIFSVGVAMVLRDRGLEVNLKWPNDFIVRKKKIGGILSEYDAQGGIMVVGFGINCNLDIDDFPVSIRDHITTIRKELGYDIGLQELIEDIVRVLRPVYEDILNGRTSDWVKSWRENSISIGKSVIVKLPDQTIKGYSIDIDDQGRLLVRTDFGVEKIVAGDVKFIE